MPVNISINTNTVAVQENINYISVNDPNNPNIVDITQPVTQIVEIITSGPKGDKGDPGPIPNTGSFVTTSSFNNFTSSYNTGSFTGSFSGSLFGTASYVENLPFLKNQTDKDIVYIKSHESIFNPSDLTILDTSIFIVESNAEYYVLGDLINSGSIQVDGTLKIGGIFYNTGIVTGTGIIE